MRTKIGTLFALTVLGIQAVAPSSGFAQEIGDLTLERMSTDMDDGTTCEFDRGVLLVPQNRAAPNGASFALEFYRFPALPGADPGTPPIFHLNGGPGWPGFHGEPERPPLLEANVLPRTRHADLVFVGQRGIGTSGPNTVCQGARPPSVDQPFDRDALSVSAYEPAVACREEWEPEGVDLQGITVIEAANDVRDVAAALGYEKIQVHGGNFDTDIPTVIVHGDWDLSTPLENALELRPHFKNHRFVLVERGTHGALGEALRSSAEFRDGLDRFMATGDMSGLPERVTLSLVEWLAPPERSDP